jgi:hypothetical protein
VSGFSLAARGFFVFDMARAEGFRVHTGRSKAFERNTEVTVQFRQDGSPFALRFSIAQLPSDPMQQRLADERVGYFTTSFFELGAAPPPLPVNEQEQEQAGSGGWRRASEWVDRRVTVINRRRLEPHGGSVDSEFGSTNSSHHFVVYYIDPSVPPMYRPALKRGVENWNKAFAQLHGFEYGPIRAVLPNDPTCSGHRIVPGEYLPCWPRDYDAGDVRFNSISW